MTERMTQRTPQRIAQRTLRRILTLATLTLLSATLALAQTAAPPAHPQPPSLSNTNWGSAEDLGAPKRILFVVTTARPTHRITCRVQTFTDDQLTCKGPFGRTRIYKAQDIAAIILPGDFATRVGFGLGFTGAAAAATWGTVVLAATCTPCAVGVGIAAFLLFVVDLGTQAADPYEDQLLYLAPGQTLQVKFRD